MICSFICISSLSNNGYKAFSLVNSLNKTKWDAHSQYTKSKVRGHFLGLIYVSDSWVSSSVYVCRSVPKVPIYKISKLIMCLERAKPMYPLTVFFGFGSCANSSTARPRRNLLIHHSAYLRIGMLSVSWRRMILYKDYLPAVPNAQPNFPHV